jgi:hypothetical protein
MSTDEIEKLEMHSRMLGQIAAEVAEFATDENCSTLSAVRLMKARCLELEADSLRQLADQQINNHEP